MPEYNPTGVESLSHPDPAGGSSLDPPSLDPADDYRAMYEDGQYPIGSNQLPLHLNFGERLRYKNADYFQAYGLPKPLDSLYDKNFFGRVDRVQNVMVPRQRSVQELVSGVTLQLPKLYEQISQNNVVALDFVASAFFKFKRNMKLALDGGALARTGTNILEIDATRGWTNYRPAYSSQFKYLIRAYEQNLYSLDKKDFNNILTFKDYVEGLYNYLLKGDYGLPITLTEFVISPIQDPLISGIGIELANENHSEDLNKYTGYLRDVNFPYYVKAARKFGFYVDKNAPWRLFADPLSGPMLKEIEELWSPAAVASMYNSTPTMRPDFVFDPLETSTIGVVSWPGFTGWSAAAKWEWIYFSYYDRTYTLDIQLLKEELVKAWNLFVVENPKVVEVVPGTIKCPTINFQVVNLRYTISMAKAHQLGHRFWFEFYMHIRERETKVTYNNKPLLLNRAMEIVDAMPKHRGYTHALKYLNNLFKPYLYDERLFRNNKLTRPA